MRIKKNSKENIYFSQNTNSTRVYLISVNLVFNRIYSGECSDELFDPASPAPPANHSAPGTYLVVRYDIKYMH